MSKEERAKLALKRRQEEVAALKKITEEKRTVQKKYLEQASLSSGHQDNRRHWDGRDGDREKQREETLLIKDREKEIEAIKVC